MCGIAGMAAPAGAVTSPAQLQPMLDCLAHRGPDDHGSYLADGVVLGHRRLAVIDVAAGHQPLRGARPGTVLVINGEIYNYRQLRLELESAGHVFRTHSDSEVAAHAYDRWGDAFLERLDGMFALALWDEPNRRLLLARDRMGEKPLFYWERDGLLLFASELSALLAHPAVTTALDPVALSQYLAFEYVPAPGSLIAGVRKLEPGCALSFDTRGLRRWPYWSLDARPTIDLPYAAAVAHLRGLLEEAVQARLVSDVPLGIFLSGGLDSSTIAALAARAGPIDTFSIGFDETSFDERAHARAVARHIGARHHEHVVRGADMPALVPGLSAWLDEPIGDASVLPTFILSRFARQHVTVALGGDGGDELFAGYPMHQAHQLLGFTGRLPGPLARLLRWGAAALPVAHRNFTFQFKAATFLRGASAAAPLNHLLWMSSFAPDEQSRLLAPEVFAAGGGGRAAFAPALAHWAGSAGAPLLARATHLDALTYLPDDILVKVDRASMAVALEVRAPFLARAVVEFAFGLPDSFRMKRYTGKRILRDAVRDLLPPFVLKRPKKGFGIPVAAWLNGELGELVNDVLDPASLRASGLYQPAAVQRLLHEHRARVADHRKPLWTLLVLELWRRQHRVATVAASSPTASALAC
ncbi:MAG: asparagine synthase (glutamine-hydrolyzing) [Gemmatimonadetes bacterium]|nr:asparagine synthase (glutamine-hydrolyzing) [Gemmatimonadota bacterium]